MIRRYFVNEWSRNGRGLLVCKFSTKTDMDGVNLGIYEARTDGSRKLVARPATRNQGPVDTARYSPDGSLLAIAGGRWFQLVHCPGGRTAFFRTGLTYGVGMPVWIDDRRLVLPGMNSLLMVDVVKQTIKPWVNYGYINSMVYSKSRGKLYVCMKPSTRNEQAIYAADPKTSQTQRVSIGSLASVFHIYGVTSDGKYAVVSATEPSSSSSTAQSGTTGIWAVELDTGKHTLISRDSIMAALLPGN